MQSGRGVRALISTHMRRREIKRQARLLALHHQPIQLEIGAAGHPVHSDGWIVSDLPEFDALDERRWRSLFRPRSVDCVLAEHVVEHWTPAQLSTFLGILGTYLALRGFLRLAVPDGYHPDLAYIELVRPGGSGAGAEDHKVLYTHETITAQLAASGFSARPLEFFDREGCFHQLPWSTAHGYVDRSAEHDSRNANGELAFTSLIVDAFPRAASPEKRCRGMGRDCGA